MVLAERVVDLPGITPVRPVTFLQPEDARGDVGRHVLDVGRVDRLLGAGWHEDLDSWIIVADCLLVERTFDARVRLVLAHF